MSRNTRLLIVMGVAVVTAALASFGIYEAIRRRPAPKTDPLVDVVVAAQPIEMGVSLTESHVKLIAWPARSQVAGAFAKVEDVVNRGLVAGVAENEEELDARVCDCCQTAAVATQRGLLVAYRDRGPDEVRDISVVRFESGRWTEPHPLHSDGWKIAGCPVNGPAMDATSDHVGEGLLGVEFDSLVAVRDSLV